jgi:hypothetical protein
MSEPERLSGSIEALLERIGARIRAVDPELRDARSRQAIMERARNAPLSVCSKYVWVSDGRSGGHMARTWCCPPEDEWEHWICVALDYMALEFTETLIARLGMEPHAREIMHARLVAWKAQESGSVGSSSGPPKRRSRQRSGKDTAAGEQPSMAYDASWRLYTAI